MGQAHLPQRLGNQSRIGLRPVQRAERAFVLLLAATTLWAQLTTGALEGTLRAADGHPLVYSPILITGGAGFHAVIHSNANGEFAVTLPYGRYSVAGVTVFVAPQQTTHVDLPAGNISPHSYPEAFSLSALLFSREPSIVTEPLDFTGLSDNRLAVMSQGGASWTETQYKFQGMDATDSYQPGHPLIFPDVQALEEVVVRRAFTGTEAGVFLSEPGSRWRGALSTANTGVALSSSNLPAPASRGEVQQAERFRWFTRDRLEIGGPLTKWADIYASGSGQWASQTEPLAAAGTDQRSRLLFGNARGRVLAGAHDSFDALYSGSRIDLSDGGVPAGLEALTGNRMMPSFVLPGGFPGEPETDHLDFVQVGWTHLASAASGLGVLQVRYQYSTAHLDTDTPPNGESSIELLGGQVSGAPPLANLATRPRHQFAGAWQPGVLRAIGTRHRIAAGGGWELSAIRNRFSTPFARNLITADGVPAFLVEFNTPLDSRERVRSFSTFITDHVDLTRSLSLDLSASADFSRGWLPGQPDLIVWNNLAPHAGFAWQVPNSHGLVFRGAYFREYAPLAGRYLDFGDPNSLGGSVYQPGDPGSLLLRFGGPYSSISPVLRRPYSDEFDIGAEFSPVPGTTAGVHLFRRDEKDRLAAMDNGVPASAFTPVSILDPGPDGIAGTFDDRQLTVYSQNPDTLGQDRYLLTNPAGLRMLNAGVVAEAGTQWRRLSLHASFAAEKSYGPTNPGDGVYENDPGVVGALFQDPNTAINATGRSFMDRAYIGKIQASYRLSRAWGGIELSSVAVYLDGLAFARQLLVTGLPQGPFLVATTVRGSPNGGNRSQYVVDWNLRLSRQFGLAGGKFTVSADVLNVTNAAQRLQEDDLSGPSFNLRLPVAIEPPRFVRLGFRYDF